MVEWLRACEEIEVEIAGVWNSKGLSMLKHVEPGNHDSLGTGGF